MASRGNGLQRKHTQLAPRIASKQRQHETIDLVDDEDNLSNHIKTPVARHLVQNDTNLRTVPSSSRRKSISNSIYKPKNVAKERISSKSTHANKSNGNQDRITKQKQLTLQKFETGEGSAGAHLGSHHTPEKSLTRSKQMRTRESDVPKYDSCSRRLNQRGFFNERELKDTDENYRIPKIAKSSGNADEKNRDVNVRSCDDCDDCDDDDVVEIVDGSVRNKRKSREEEANNNRVLARSESVVEVLDEGVCDESESMKKTLIKKKLESISREVDHDFEMLKLKRRHTRSFDNNERNGLSKKYNESEIRIESDDESGRMHETKKRNVQMNKKVDDEIESSDGEKDLDVDDTDFKASRTSARKRARLQASLPVLSTRSRSCTTSPLDAMKSLNSFKKLNERRMASQEDEKVVDVVDVENVHNEIVVEDVDGDGEECREKTLTHWNVGEFRAGFDKEECDLSLCNLILDNFEADENGIDLNLSACGLTLDDLMLIWDRVLMSRHKIISLSLNNNKLEGIPDSIFQLKELSSLDLQFNCLKSIPKSIGKVRKLLKLDLRHNQLSTLPRAVSRLKRLKFLDISYNNITELPRLKRKLKLEVLSVSHNQLKQFPIDFFRLSKDEGDDEDRGLDTLDVSYNEIERVPEEAEVCVSSVCVLSVTGNPFQERYPLRYSTGDFTVLCASAGLGFESMKKVSENENDKDELCLTPENQKRLMMEHENGIEEEVNDCSGQGSSGSGSILGKTFEEKANVRERILGGGKGEARRESRGLRLTEFDGIKKVQSEALDEENMDSAIQFAKEFDKEFYGMRKNINN